MAQAEYLKAVRAGNPGIIWPCDDVDKVPRDLSTNVRPATTFVGSGHRWVDDPTLPCQGAKAIYLPTSSGFTRGSLIGSTNFGWECWIKPTARNATANASLLCNNNGGSNGWELLWQTDQTVQWIAQGVAFATASAGKLRQGRWTWLAAMMEGGTWKYYFDGAFDSSGGGASPANPSGGVLGVGRSGSGMPVPLLVSNVVYWSHPDGGSLAAALTANAIEERYRAAVQSRIRIWMPPPASVTLGYIAAATALYAPAVTSVGEVDVGFISSSTNVYALTLLEDIAVPFRAAATTVYALALVPYETVPFIAAATTVYALTIRQDVALPYIPERTIVARPTLRRNVTNVVAPVISGTAKQGLTVEASPGSWTGPPLALTYQWRRCNAGGTSCSDISGATSRTYVVTAADVGGTLRVAVTADGVAATSAASAVVSAGSTLPTGVAVPAVDVSLWQFILCDRASGTEIADVSFVTQQKHLKVRLSRPTEVSGSIKSAEALARNLWTDGYPFLSVGRRTVKVRHRLSPAHAWELYANCVIWYLEDVGGANTSDSSFLAYDPMMMWNFRFVRDATGNMVFPTFNGGGPISGPDWIQQIVRNSVTNSGPAFDMEGAMGLDYSSGLFDLVTPPAVDCQAKIDNWPMLIGDLAGRLTSGPCDTWVDPVENSGATIGRLNAVTQAGQQTIVHYDYGVGDFSCTLRRSFDMSTLSNKLRYLLGPSDGLPKGHWRGSIEATNSGLPDPPQSTINARLAASRSDFLIFQDLRIFDDGNRENDVRELFMRLWQTEQLFRVEPREMLFVAPVIDAPFRVRDLRRGDTITINCSADLRQGFSAQQRVFGWDVDITDNNAEQLQELVVSADGL